ncbi:putative ORFan [Tupanvirus deep ocean]|uniref:ORFan n=2 Tax=Tupanvirus TaxID=2094720 RepID=A0AC62A943_9VIRU|nr:putative ORFan [Tupanvirus deep ocean]QKU34297.1 putative ORFan [Tupanvirus deep ocean]
MQNNIIIYMDLDYTNQKYLPLLSGAGGIPPNDPRDILKKIRIYLKEKDAYLSNIKDPLANTNIKYIANVNLIAIYMQNIIPHAMKYGAHLTSYGYVCLATYYQHRRNKMYSFRTNEPKKKLFEYGSENAIKNLIFYPFITYIMYKPFSTYFTKPRMAIPLTFVTIPLIYLWDEQVTFASKLIAKTISQFFFQKK